MVDFKWDGNYPKKKNWALDNLPFRNEWILIVDADELIVPELAAEIAQCVTSPGKFVGYYINRRFMFMDRWIKHCGYYPSWNLRLLKKGGTIRTTLRDRRHQKRRQRGPRTSDLRWANRLAQNGHDSRGLSDHRGLHGKARALMRTGRDKYNSKIWAAACQPTRLATRWNAEDS